MSERQETYLATEEDRKLCARAAAIATKCMLKNDDGSAWFQRHRKELHEILKAMRYDGLAALLERGEELP